MKNILKLANDFEFEAQLNYLEDHLGDEFVLPDIIVNYVKNVVENKDSDFLDSKEFDNQIYYLFSKKYNSKNDYEILFSIINEKNENYQDYLNAIRILYTIYGSRGVSDFKNRLEKVKEDKIVF